MTTAPAPADTVDDPAAAADFIARLEAAATRVQTSVGPGAQMVWRRWGSGPALVLVHGGAGSWLHWVRNIEHLARTHAVWVPDLPGFGDSDLPDGDHDADALALSVREGLLQLLRGAPFDLVGFSFGGLVSGYVAAEAPAGLQRLVLVSVAGMGLAIGALVLKPMRGVTDPKEREAVLRFNLNALMLNDPARIDALALQVQDHSTARERAKNRRLVTTDALIRLSRRWRCPAFGIWGAQDALYRHQIGALEDRIALLGLRARTLLEDAGHWLPYERTDAFHAALQTCLEMP